MIQNILSKSPLSFNVLFGIIIGSSVGQVIYGIAHITKDFYKFLNKRY